MSSAPSVERACLGFFTTVEDAQHGLFGGYLLLDHGGRPLEFHCTAPIKPNRAQEILYGPTLRPYLVGEQIGQTLVRKSMLAPTAVCVDSQEALELRNHVQLPVMLVCGDGTERSEPRTVALTEMTAGRNRLAVAARHAEDLECVERFVSALPEAFDLTEPFGRIREAIAEAQRGAD
jgi:hypothetical protein